MRFRPAHQSMINRRHDDRASCPAQHSLKESLEREEQPKAICEIAWKAQLRLCARYRKLARTGKPANVVTAAIARELAGFVWAIARRVPPAAS